MKAEEFWEKVESILNGYSKSDDPDGCDFFVGEMDELFEKWAAEKEK